jgi:hypothetical protein
MTHVALILIAFVLASSCWWLQGFNRRMRVYGALLIIAFLATSPWFSGVHNSNVVLHALQTLVCCAVFIPKLVDASVSPSTWRRRRFRQWLGYLVNPFVLVYRAHLQDPGAPVGNSIRQVAGGLLRILTGSMILLFAFRHDFSSGSFWVEHTIKTVAVYLIFFDGQFVAATGLMRIFTGRSLEFSRNPILASSPADFWRRYNRDAGRFLYMDIFVPLVGKRALLRGTAIVFLANGVLHEYLSWVLTGQLLGYQIVFFAVQGLATLLTLSWRPRGWLRLLGIAGTLTFNLITSSLFFASVDLLVDWYDTQNPLAWL